jgi:hypothetical protein
MRLFPGRIRDYDATGCPLLAPDAVQVKQNVVIDGK